MRSIVRSLLLTVPAACLLAGCSYLGLGRSQPNVAAAPPPPPVATSGALIAPQGSPATAASGSSTAPVVAPGSAIRLSANDSLALLSNNTAIGLTETGIPYTVYFAGDGAARFREETMADTGTWHVLPDGQVCSRLPRISGAETCYILSRYGDVIMFQSPDGLAVGSVRIVAGNPQAL